MRGLAWFIILEAESGDGSGQETKVVQGIAWQEGHIQETEPAAWYGKLIFHIHSLNSP